MKVLGIISTATLFLLLGTAVPALAQDDHHDIRASSTAATGSASFSRGR